MRKLDCGCIYSEGHDRTIHVNHCTKHRIEMLKESTQRTSMHCKTEAECQVSIFNQYWEGAITIAELNMRVAEYLGLVNHLAFELQEMSMLEDLRQSELLNEAGK